MKNKKLKFVLVLIPLSILASCIREGGELEHETIVSSKEILGSDQTQLRKNIMRTTDKDSLKTRTQKNGTTIDPFDTIDPTKPKDKPW
ncbi:hypothetical protein D1631_05695 [Chryseobacterium nematophagum]|uniref:Lipoprotein n=1 Tax=Chryseobacterium nematophagum TaxID=2305228 RepID=A0A3M7TD04_9FLAO|nr:hypothetical protein [Chryseobacterium nematophagum]RNA61462.1 hypothetical protein D1631_05695 [Chryseobacterium nematophagum]